jgi:uroporphyrinogen-III synthase
MTRTTSHESRVTSSSERPLAGRSIVVTRPARQAQSLARLVEEAGGQAVLFPAIEIRDVEDLGPFMKLVDRLDEYDFAIFISPNSVERAMSLIAARRPLPAGLTIATIGGGGARALERFGVTDAVAPRSRYDSEALLEQAAFEVVSFKRVVIFRGVGGREHLGEALRERGATVDYAECYRRCVPDADPAPLLKAWARGRVDAVTVTSSEGLRNLFDLLGDDGRSLLARTPLFVPHPRIAEAAQALEVRTVIVTGPGDDGLMDGLTTFFSVKR